MLISRTFICLILFLLSTLQVIAYEETVSSERNLYKVRFYTSEENIPLRTSHKWFVEFKTSEGNPFIPKNILIDGGMPSHGHGFPSEPRLTRHLGNGVFTLDGMLFNMAGDWEIRLHLSGPKGIDQVIHSFKLASGSVVATNDSPNLNVALLNSMHLSSLEPDIDYTNKFSLNPIAVELGQKLFFDKNLSKDKNISCETCHLPSLLFTDGKKKSFGSSETKRNSSTLLGSSQSKWFYWDGRRDTLWNQALTPFETIGEMDNDRASIVKYTLSKNNYFKLISKLDKTLEDISINELPSNASPYGKGETKNNWQKLSQQEQHKINTIFSLIGKSIAAYVTTLEHQTSLFDQTVDRLNEKQDHGLTESQLNGLMLYMDIDKTHCLRCHNGPLFTNNFFHNIGTGPDEEGNFDYGRVFGIQAIAYDIFNCQGQYSDDPNDCDHVKFSQQSKQPPSAAGAFKVPTLRGVSLTAPYMHDGRFDTLREVIEYYRKPPDIKEIPHELPELNLSDEEVNALVEFLKIL